jgi:hypothetical protein
MAARRLGAAALVATASSLAPGMVRAEHDHHAMAVPDDPDESGSQLSAGVAIEAATYDNMIYVGSYQGVTPQLNWIRGGFGADATLGFYHLEKNGLGLYGLGDLMFAGHATLIATDSVRAGATLHMMLPTGSQPEGFGMGHIMAMPSGWATWRGEAVTVATSAGYARALNAPDGAHHDHGSGPLVEPMSLEELTWSAGADLDVGHSVRLGASAQGAIPTGSSADRVFGAGRVTWGTPRIETKVELQVGIMGDPFTIRGVVETALRF